MKPHSIVKVGLLTSLVAPMIACTSLAIRRADSQYVPRGPGVLFATVDDAVIDALAYGHEQALRTHSLDRFRGGPIIRTSDGYTYEELEVAPADAPTRIEYTLSSTHVARVHVYPRSMRPSQNTPNEQPSRADRRSVDRVDPLHRPLFVLTPSLLVKAYYGPTQPVELVADLTTYDPERLVADASK